MVESEFLKNSGTHHDRGHGNTPRDVSSDDDNSRVSESTPRDDNEHEHHDEENQHKERNTQMTQKTGRILSSLAIAIMFVCTLSADASGFADRGQRGGDARGNDGRENTFTFEYRGGDRREVGTGNYFEGRGGNRATRDFCNRLDTRGADGRAFGFCDGRNEGNQFRNRTGNGVGYQTRGGFVIDGTETRFEDGFGRGGNRQVR